MCFRKQILKYKIVKNLTFFNFILVLTFVFYLINDNLPFYFLFYICVVNIFFVLIILRKYSQYSYKEKENEYNTGIYMEYLIISSLILPGIYKAIKIYQSAQQNISNYVGNK